MPLQIIQKDITTMDCDIIVNPTDENYSGSGGIDFAIHSIEGKQLEQACHQLAKISAGEVNYTNAYNMKSTYIIHTVGPIWHGGTDNEEALLKSCYTNSLFLAVNLSAKSIAFPLISSGTFGFPKDRVLRIAIDAISEFFAVTNIDLDVIICVVDKNSFTLSQENSLNEYIKNIKIDTAFFEFNVCQRSIKLTPENYYECQSATIFSDDYNLNLSTLPPLEDGFAVTLLKLIDKKGMSDVECYKKANVSKQTFSKIMNNKNYNPNKRTVLSFAISLQLSLDETENLLKTVGFSLSHSNIFDVIIEYYISNGIYDIFEINSALFKYDQVTLGC